MGLREAIEGFRAGLRKSPGIPVMGSLAQAPAHPVSVSGPGAGGTGTLASQLTSGQSVEVVDTLRTPDNSNVPGSWGRQWLGPGRPFTNQSYGGDESETEPRSFQYISSINSTITPRLAYGLMGFTELKSYAQDVPEVALCLRLSTEELKAFIPTLVNDKDEKLDIPELEWMTTRPDRFNPWPVWLSRFLFNVLVYDAPAVYKIRDVHDSEIIKKSRHGYFKASELANIIDPKDGMAEPVIRWWCTKCGAENDFRHDADLIHKNEQFNSARHCGVCEKRMTRKQEAEVDGEVLAPVYQPLKKGQSLSKIANSPVVGLRIIDGSTIFSVIDERGEQPQPPAPAFTQVIWGVPRMFLNSYQLWYRPRFLRPDAPYGKSFIEDSLPSVKLLSQLWAFELDKYTTGNIPETAFTCPPDWKSVEQILAFEDTYNDRMAGNTEERAGRIRFFPSGMATLVTKDITFNKETYDVASNAVRISAGIPKSEVGEAPEGMMGGKGFAEAMNSAFYRMNISPLQSFVEGLFNDVITENGYSGVYFKLKFPNESIDPEKEEAKYAGRFTNGGITRNEYRSGIGMPKLRDGDKGEFIVTPGGGKGEGEEGGGAGANPFGNLKPPTGAEGMKNPVDVLKEPVDVLKRPIAVKLLKGLGAEEYGVMVCIDVPSEIWSSFSGIEWPKGSDVQEADDLHITLAYMGNKDQQPADQDRLMGSVKTFVMRYKPITGKLNGIGQFLDSHKSGMACVYCNFDCPELPAMRQELVEYLTLSGFDIDDTHGYTPHMTLAYIPQDEIMPDFSSVRVQELTVTGLAAYWGKPYEVFKFGGEVAKREPYTDDQAIELGEQLEVDWDKVMLNEWIAGLAEEQEHAETTGGDQEAMGHIVLDHLMEDPNYYSKLSAAMAKAVGIELVKSCGVDARDDEYYGAPVVHAMDVQMPHQGANESNVVGIGYLGQEQRPAVWKPADGEDAKLVEWVGGELYRRAEAVYTVDRELARDETCYLVPVTWCDTIDGVKGSVQHYVVGRDIRQDVNEYEPEYTEQAAVLDYITGQMDRINKNWLTHPADDKRPVLIDSDLSFPVKLDQKVRSSFVEAWRGRELSKVVLDSVFLIIGNHDLWSDLRQCLESEEAVQGALKRATDLYNQRRIPMVAPDNNPVAEAEDDNKDSSNR